MSNLSDAQETMSLVIPERQRPVARETLYAQKDELAALNLAVNASGLDRGEFASGLGLDPSQFSKILDGTAHFPVRRNLKFHEMTQDVWLEYQAYRRGFTLVMLESETQRLLRESQEALARERERTRLLTEVLQGRALT